MSVRLTQLQCKEVICVSDGMRLGYISDVVVEVPDGKLCAIVANNSGSSLASLGVFANGKRIALTGMSVASGSSIVLDYDEEYRSQ